MANMQRFVLVVAYDGASYCGWQIQKDQATIAQTMQDTFSKVFGKRISLIGVSRTDAGVHAFGQVATFKTDIIIPIHKMLFAWNNILPKSIVIKKLFPVNMDYNPFFDIDYKIYWYQLFIERPLPFFYRYGWLVPHTLSLKKL